MKNKYYLLLFDRHDYYKNTNKYKIYKKIIINRQQQHEEEEEVSTSKLK